MARLRRPALQPVAAGEDDLPAAHALLLLCGEHMHRAQGMDHWWPWMPLDQFRVRATGRDTMLGIEGDQLVATWNTSTIPEPYHDLSLWPAPDAPALFLSAFGVLPAAWGRGVGAAVLEHVEDTARAAGLDRVRFDAVATNQVLVRWYAAHGYEPVGDLQVTPGIAVTCVEKVLG